MRELAIKVVIGGHRKKLCRSRYPMRLMGLF